jgi:magnesium transporter
MIPIDESKYQSKTTKEDEDLPFRKSRKNIANRFATAASLERIFITDCGKLLGYVTTLDLLLADKTSLVGKLVRKPDVIVHTNDIFEDALQKMRKSGATYAPVVSDDSSGDEGNEKNPNTGKIVGIVTPSDMLTEMEYEATDDVMRTSGSGGGESYFGTSIFRIVRARAGWLISLLMLQSVSSTILTKFSTLLEKHLIIALFLTMLTGTAGNAGNQSSAMVIRGLATGEINRQNSHKVLLREIKAGVFMAILLALASFFRVYITPGSNMISTLAVSIAMGITVIGSCILGTLSPLVLEYLGQDPCNCASPALATLTDVSGVLILCLISSLLLG